MSDINFKQTYTYQEFLSDFPTRKSFVNPTIAHELNNRIAQVEPIEFLPNNPIEDSFPSNDTRGWNYSIAMYGVLPDGRRAVVLIDGIEPYFYVQKPQPITGFRPGEIPPNSSPELYNSINNTLKENFLNEVRSKLDDQCKFSWEQGKPFVGWQEEYSDYLKISFTKQTNRKKAITACRRLGYSTFHDDYDRYYLVVARDYNIPLCAWSTISNYKIQAINQFKSPVFRVHIDNFKHYAGEVLKSPILSRDRSLLLTWDIECGTKTGELPTANNTSDRLFMIASTAHWWYSKTPLFKICFVDVPCDPSDDFITVVCGDERNVILAFACLFEKMTPDFCTGYNSSNFDYPWLVQRAYQYGILEMMCDIMNEMRPFNGFNTPLGHKLYNITYDQWKHREMQKTIPKVTVNNYISTPGGICSIYCREKIKIDAETYAEGTQIQTAGCISFDLMTIMKQAYPNSEKNSLDYFLSINKLGGKKDMPIHELFRIYWESVDAYTSQNTERIEKCKKEMRTVAEYCVVDSYRCQELSVIRNVIADKREVASLSYTSLCDAFVRANGMKVRQMVMARGIKRKLYFTVNTKKNPEDEKYPGAYVLPPEKGLIVSKLTLQERQTKYNDFIRHFGQVDLNDGSYRNIPYTEFSTFNAGNSGIDDASGCKIKCFQETIFNYSKNNTNFTVTVADTKAIDDIITDTQQLLGDTHLSNTDIRIFKDFLKEGTGRPVTGLDFSSLYPSLIMAYNLSPEYTISMETCDNSIGVVKLKLAQTACLGYSVRSIRFPYGVAKKDIHGFFINHENQFPTLDNGQPNPNCRFGIYPTILKELGDARNVMKVPKEYYEILNEYLDKKNDSTNKTNQIIKLCTEIDLNDFKDFETLLDEYEELITIKDHPRFGKMSWSEFVLFMSSNPTKLPVVERIELKDAIDVIISKIDYDYAHKPPKKIQTTDPANVKKILCAFEDEDVINAKNGITWEDIEFYFNYFDSKQKALKVFMNTFYGESGNKLSSMFVLAVAGSITTQGQMNIKLVKEFVETGKVEYEGVTYRQNVGNFGVKYGDTDSLYIIAPESAFKDVDIEYYTGKITKEQYWSRMVDISFVYIDKIKKEVNDLLKTTSGTKFLKMSYEEVLFPVAFLAKKKYYGIPHISIPNFNPKKLFIRGLEVKKRGVSGVLKNLCEDLMWKSMRLDNLKELLDLTYDAIDEFYKKTWDVDLFSQAKQYKPKSKKDIEDGKGNKSVLHFVERMKERGIEIKPHERFRTVNVRKYPFSYDYRGRKVPLKISDFMELVSEVKAHNMEVDIDYYMENGIVSQLARMVIYRDEFYVDSFDNSDVEIKKADDSSFKKAKQHLNYYASRYYKTYQNKGPIYQNTFKMIDKGLKNSYKKLGLDTVKVNLLCRDWEFDSPDAFFKSMTEIAETKAVKVAKGYGRIYVNNNVKGTDLTPLQRLYCGTQATQMKLINYNYRNNLNTIERDLRNMFHDLCKFMSEHRRAVDMMSLLVNKAIGVEKLYNDPVTVQSTGNTITDAPGTNEVLLNFELDDDNNDDIETSGDLLSKKQLLSSVENKIPVNEFDSLFKQTEIHLKKSFNVSEVANRLMIIYDNLYKTYLFYHQNLDIQRYLESKLDKKYNINTLMADKKSINAIVEENIEDGMNNNIIDFEF